jgi:hypothetical protein
VLLQPGEFRDALLDPLAPEHFSAAAGNPLVIVEVSDPAGAALAERIGRTAVTSLPCVVVLLLTEPALLPVAPDFPDVVLTDDARADAPGPYAPRSGLAAIEAAVRTNPVAAAALVLLLRSSGELTVPAGLIAESSTYSALQEGAEFHRWRGSRAPRAAEPGEERVQVERDGDLLRIILARPARRNAVDARMRDALTEALAPAVADPDCRVEISALGPDFSAGGDLDEFGSRPDPALAHLTRLSRSPALLLHRLAERTEVRVQGACLGAGMELPAFAGRVLAAPDARFGLPELGLGLVPGAGGTVSVPARIGRRRTAYLALSGERITAERALAWGLVDVVKPRP